jgi:hypothetical protein
MVSRSNSMNACLTDEVGVAQEAQSATVGDEAPEGFGPVEILLNEGMGREAGAAGVWTKVQ